MASAILAARARKVTAAYTMMKAKLNPTAVLDDPAIAASRLVTVEEVKKILSCGTTHVYDLINQGRLKSFKDGSNRRVYLYSVLKYLNGA
jgi:excisionase family DNA binding protein